MDEIDSIADFFARLDEIREFFDSVDGDGRSVSGKMPVPWYRDALDLWFRGHGESGLTPFPQAMRAPFINRAVEVEPIAGNPHVQLAASMFREFRHRARPLLADGSSTTSDYFLAQHYGLPTCLLDWSGNPLVGLYFAVADRARDHNDGQVFVMRSRSHSSDQVERALLREDDPLVIRQVESLLDPGMECLPDEGMPLFVRPFHRDQRMRQQDARFTLHGSHAELSKMGGADFWWEIPVPANAKARLRDELRILSVHRGTLFPDLENIVNQMRLEADDWE